MTAKDCVIEYRGISIINFTKIGYIYGICEKTDEKITMHYIGMTIKHAYDRIDEHLEMLGEKRHHNLRLQKLYDDNVELSVIIIDTVIASNTRDLIILLRYKEKMSIKLHKPTCNIIHNVQNKIKSKDKTIPNVIILSKQNNK